MFNTFRSYNRNIKYAMLSNALLAISEGLFFSGVYSVFVKLIGGNNTSLGFVTTFGGIMMLLTLLPSGILIDKLNRSLILRFGLIFYFIGYMFILNAHILFDIFIAQLFINIGGGMINPANEALIADSLVSKSREKTYGELYFVSEIFHGMGPLLAVGLFFIIGDNWTLENLRSVFYIGFVFLILAVILKFQMSEKFSLGVESESENMTNNKMLSGSISNNWWFVPSVLIILAFVIASGAGLSVLYFSIFFKEVYFLKPSIVNFIFFLSSLLSGFLGVITPRIATRIGRVQTMFWFQLGATFLFLGIAFIPPLIIVIPFWLLRGAMMNSTNPVKQGVVMDLVPKSARGKLSSIETLAFSLVFSLTAGIGGVVLDIYSFQILFITTTTIYFLGTIPLWFLRKYVNDGIDSPELIT